MQIIRTILWVLLLAGLILFSVVNWDPTVTVRIWQGLVVDTKIPAIVLVSFAIGFVPMWLVYRASKWQLKRKIASLESAVRTAAATPVVSDTQAETPLRAPMSQPTQSAEPLSQTAPAPEPNPSLSSDDPDGNEPTPRGTLG